MLEKVGSPHRLMKDFNASVSDPLWSPDGSRLAILLTGSLWLLKVEGETAAILSLEGKPVELPGSEIRQVDISGGETHRLAYAEFWNWLPYVSPDGTCLLYSLPVSGGGNLLWTRVGKDFTRAQMRREGFDPAWSPQGDRIVFVSAGESE